MDPVITTSKLTKRFRRLLAVDELDLAVEAGEVFGFLGPNGAGKSTTLRMMVGLIRPTRGSVKLFGCDTWKQHCAALRRVGAMIESPAFYMYLSGRDNLRIIANSGGAYSAKDIDAALDAVGLLDRAKDKVKSYSQGMRQRLGIALALVGKPDLILLDEPTNGLDPQGMKEVRDLIRRLSGELNLTVFLSSHLLHEVEQVCTRIAVINKGKVIESGTVRDLLSESNNFEVRVDHLDKATEAVGRLDWVKVNPSSNGLLNVSLTGSSSELNRVLVENGVGVSALIPRETSLEELYLRLMDDSNGSSSSASRDVV